MEVICGVNYDTWHASHKTNETNAREQRARRETDFRTKIVGYASIRRDFTACHEPLDRNTSNLN